jgi:uncharacterized protein (TIGR02284 family)
MANDTVDVLQDLIKTAHDGHKGFLAASQEVRDGRIKQVLVEGAQRCHTAAGELAELLRALGKDVPDGGTVAGALHRGWLQLKAGVAATDLAIIEECERGEDSAKGSYRDALEKELNADARFVIERQYHGVQENHDRIRALRDSLRGHS